MVSACLRDVVISYRVFAFAVPIFAATSAYALCELLEWNEGLDLMPHHLLGGNQ